MYMKPLLSLIYNFKIEMYIIELFTSFEVS